MTYYSSIANINGNSGIYDNKIQNPSVRYGRNAINNYFGYLKDYTSEVMPPLQFQIKYLPEDKVDFRTLNKEALMGAAFEEIGKQTAVSTATLTRQFQSAFGDKVSADALDLNHDGNIDIGEYATGTLLADMASTDSSVISTENITGTITTAGQNETLPYINKKNYAAAQANLSAIHQYFNLEAAKNVYAANANNLIS